MNWKYYAITLGFALMVASLIINDLTRMKKDNKTEVIIQPELSDIDGLLNEIDTLELKSDTIKLYYEKKVYNYHILPRSERIKLFADRINR
jgi:hypothetical protein